jgi:hypothetical protein
MPEGGLPTFYGYSHESVHEFDDELKSYFASKDINANRWVRILKTQLRGPARIKHATAEANGGEIHAAIAALGVNPADHVIYNTHLAWLRNTFHNEEVQQRIKDELLRIKQGASESPRDFYTRILHLIEVANLPEATREYTAEICFMNGIHSDIADHINMFGQREFGQKMAMADATWAVKNKNATIQGLTYVLPRGLQQKLNPTTPLLVQ